MEELPTDSGHVRSGVVLHLEESRAHCASVRSDNGSDDCQTGLAGWCCRQHNVHHGISRLFHVMSVTFAQCEHAVICEENRAPMVDLPILVFSVESQSSCTVLGCEHKSFYVVPSCHPDGVMFLTKLSETCSLLKVIL